MSVCILLSRYLVIDIRFACCTDVFVPLKVATTAGSFLVLPSPLVMFPPPARDLLSTIQRSVCSSHGQVQQYLQ